MVSVSRLRRLVSVILIIAILTTCCIAGTISASASSTGTGLADWAVNAYYSNWSYVYGGTSPGTVDCSGLIYTYNGVGGNRVDMLGSSSYSGSVGGGIPNIHGLGLWQPGHVGVYVGGGMAVDARNEYYGVCYESASSSSWQMWFKVAGVSYPSTGWESFNGSYYYYENGEYITNTSRTIDGTTYSFGSSGASDRTPDSMSSVAESSGSGSSSGSSSDSGSSSSSPQSSGANTSSTIKNGDSGSKVSELQERLKELGFYTGEITGYFGNVTESAYRAFQTAAGVTVDGIAGQSDLDILYSSSAPYAETEEETTEGKTTEEKTTEEDTKTVSFSNGDSHDDIFEIQEYLISLRYFNDDATGYFGDLTEAAIIAFQKANGLEPTGIADAETLEVLFNGTAVENPYSDEMETDDVTPETTAATASETETDATSATYAAAGRLSNNIIDKTNKIASDAVSNLTSDENFNNTVKTSDKTSTNFILWLVVVVAIMAIVVFVVYKNEQNKRARRARARARMNRYW